MNCQFDGNSPWIVERDEVDLLEEDIEDIYDEHESFLGHDSNFEHSVLCEQMETEELGDMELTMHWGARADEKRLENESNSCFYSDEPNIPLKNILKERARRHPLYEDAFVWSDKVFKLAKKFYLSGERDSLHAFRIYVNVRLIPIKLSGALLEDWLEADPMTLDIVIQEEQLALIYLKRTIESMRSAPEIFEGKVAQFISAGNNIGTQVARKLEQIKKRRNKL